MGIMSITESCACMAPLTRGNELHIIYNMKVLYTMQNSALLAQLVFRLRYKIKTTSQMRPVCFD